MLKSTKVNKNAFRLFDLIVKENPKVKATYASGWFTNNTWIMLDSDL